LAEAFNGSCASFERDLALLRTSHQPDDVRGIDDLYDDAIKVRHLLPDVMKQIRHWANEVLTRNCQSGISKNALDIPKDLKRRRATKEKIQWEKEGLAHRVSDVCRARYITDNPHQLAALSAVIEVCNQYALELPHGARISKADNRIKKPTLNNLMDMKAVINIPLPEENGRWHACEVQATDRVFLKEIEGFKESSHETYERARHLLRRRKAGEPQAYTRKADELIGCWNRSLKNNHTHAAEVSEIRAALEYTGHYKALFKDMMNLGERHIILHLEQHPDEYDIEASLKELIDRRQNNGESYILVEYECTPFAVILNSNGDYIDAYNPDIDEDGYLIWEQQPTILVTENAQAVEVNLEDFALYTEVFVDDLRKHRGMDPQSGAHPAAMMDRPSADQS